MSAIVEVLREYRMSGGSREVYKSAQRKITALQAVQRAAEAVVDAAGNVDEIPEPLNETVKMLMEALRGNA